MDRAEVKKYLYQVSNQKQKIQRKADKVDELLELAANPRAVRYDALKVQISMDPDKTTKLIDEAVDLQRDISDEKLKLMQMIHKRVDYILQLTKPLHIDILCDKYIYGKTLEEIRNTLMKSEDEQYRYDYLSREHGNALDALAMIISNQ